MQLGPTQIHLMPREDARAAESGHVAIVLGDDYDSALARLRVLGHVVEPRVTHGLAARLRSRPGGQPRRGDGLAPGHRCRAVSTADLTETTSEFTAVVPADGENTAVDLARIGWLATVVACLIAVVILALQGYYGYAGVTLAVAISAAINLT